MTASAFPVRAAVISTVSPSGDAVFGSAPASSSVSITAWRGRWWRRATAASRRSGSPPSPRRRRAAAACAVSRSSARTAQWSAVVPSTSAALTSARALAAAGGRPRLPFLTASISARVGVGRHTGAAATADHASATALADACCITAACRPFARAIALQMSTRAGADAELLHLHAELVAPCPASGSRSGCSRPRTTCRLPLIELPCRRPTISGSGYGGVHVAVAHAAAVENHRVVEQRAVAVGRLVAAAPGTWRTARGGRC